MPPSGSDWTKGTDETADSGGDKFMSVQVPEYNNGVVKHFFFDQKP
jgi:hypothetical protein